MPVELSDEVVKSAAARVRTLGLWCERALSLEGVPLHLASRWLQAGSEDVQEGIESPRAALALAMEFAESSCLQGWLQSLERAKLAKDHGQWQRYAALIALRFPQYAGASKQFGVEKRSRSLEQELRSLGDARADG